MMLSLLLASLAHVNDAAAEGVLARYDLAPVLAAFDEGVVSESLYMTAGSQYDEEDRTDLGQLYGRADADAVVELLARMFLEEFEYEGRELALQGEDELLVVAPEEVQAQVRGALGALEEAFTGAVELQVDVIALPADGPPPFDGRGVVGADELTQLPTAGARGHESYRVRVQPGRTSVIERIRRLPLLVDHEVEIAQGSFAYDPIVAEAEAGTRLLLRGAPAGDGLALSVVYAHGAPLHEEPERVVAPMRGMITVTGGAEEGREAARGERFVEAPGTRERHEIAFRCAAFDTLLPAGRALALSSSMRMPSSNAERSNERDRELVVIRRAAGEARALRRFKPEGARRELVFLNAESLYAPRTRVEGALRTNDGDGMMSIPRLRAELRDDPSSFLVDWIDARFSTWRLVGPWLVCVYDPSWDGDALARLEAMVASRGGSDAPLTLAVEGRAQGGAVASWRVPVRAGAQVAGLVGISTTSLVDFAVEVAQFAAAPEPNVFPQFAGLAFRGRALALASGTRGFDVTAYLNHRRSAPRAMELDGPLMTRIEKTTFDRVRVDERAVFAPGLEGGTRVLGDRQGAGAIAVSVR